MTGLVRGQRSQHHQVLPSPARQLQDTAAASNKAWSLSEVTRGAPLRGAVSGTDSESCEGAGWGLPPRNSPEGAGSHSFPKLSRDGVSPEDRQMKAQMRCGPHRPLVWAHSPQCPSWRAGMLSWVHPTSWAMGNLQAELSACLPRTKLQRGAQRLTPQDRPRPPSPSDTTLLPRCCTSSCVHASLPAPAMALRGWPVHHQGRGDGGGRRGKSLEGCTGLWDALWKHCTGTARTCNATTMHHSCPRGGCAVLCASEGRGPAPQLACRDMGVCKLPARMQSPGQ